MNHAEKHSEISGQSDEILKKELASNLSKLLNKSNHAPPRDTFDQSLLERLDSDFLAATEGHPLMLGFDILNYNEQPTGLAVVTNALAKHLRPKSYVPPSRLITPMRRQSQTVSATPYRAMTPTSIEVIKVSTDGTIELRGQQFEFSHENALYTISAVVSSEDGKGPVKAWATYTWNTLSDEVASRISNPEYADMLFIDPKKSDIENMIVLAKRLEELQASNNA
jgi:hypothetical protein